MIYDEDFIEYDVDDVVTIRSLSSLLDEYGMDERRARVRVYLGFTLEMRIYCGQKFKIYKKTRGIDGRLRYKLMGVPEETYEDRNYNSFKWGSAMFEESVTRLQMIKENGNLLLNSSIRKFDEVLI